MSEDAYSLHPILDMWRLVTEPLRLAHIVAWADEKTEENQKNACPTNHCAQAYDYRDEQGVHYRNTSIRHRSAFCPDCGNPLKGEK